MLFEKAAEKFWWLSAFFTVLEYPFVLLRRATILLVEAEGYSRPWFLVSLVGAPLAVCAYLELPWAAYIIGGGAGGLAALCFGLLLPEVCHPPRSSSPCSVASHPGLYHPRHLSTTIPPAWRARTPHTLALWK